MSKKARPSAAPLGSSESEPQAGRRRRTEAKIVRRFNRRLVLVLVAVLVVCGAGVHALHAVMIERNADGLLERATEAEQAGETEDAVRLLSQFLQFRPDDMEATERLAVLLDGSNATPRVWYDVFLKLEKVVRREPDRDSARRRLIDVAMKLRRFSDAEFHVDALLKSDKYKDDAELVRLKARAHAGQPGRDRAREAAELYLAAIALAPEVVESYAELAGLLSTQKDALPWWDVGSGRFVKEPLNPDEPPKKTKAAPDQVSAWAGRAEEQLLEVFSAAKRATTASAAANQVLDLMVDRAKPQWEALLARATQRHGKGDLASAAADVRQALDDPDAKQHAELLLLGAVIETDRSRKALHDGDSEEAGLRRTEARRLAELGLNVDPPEPRFRRILADAELSGGTTAESLEAAIKHLRTGLAQAEALQEEAALEAAMRHREAELDFRFSLANLLIAQAELDASRAGAEKRVGVTKQAVRDEIDGLREARCPPEFVDLLEARLSLLERDWAGAAKQLEALRPRLLNRPELLKQVDLMLGACYVRIQNPDRRIEVFRRAKAADPLWPPARTNLAEALAEAGRIDEAIREYDGAANLPGVAQAKARLVLVDELRKPADRRNLDAVERAVGAAEKAAPGDTAVILLRAELLAARGDYEAAKSLLAEAAAKLPDSHDLWQARVRLAATRPDHTPEERLAETEALVAEAERQSGDSVDLRLAKAEAARLKGADAVREALVTLATDAEGFSGDDQVRLYEGLTRYATGAGAADVARDLWRKVAEFRPDSLAAWLAMAQMAADSGDSAGLREALTAVRRIEGEGGPNGDLVEALWQIGKIARDPALKGDRERLKQALEGPRSLLLRAEKQRSYWAAVPRALGLLESLIGDDEAREAAFEHFEQARRLGDLSPTVVRGIVAYHRGNGRLDLAQAVLEEAERENPALAAGESTRLALEAASKRGDVDGSIALASRLAETTGALRDRLNHAGLLLVKQSRMPAAERDGEPGKTLLAQAEAIYRKAVDELPQQPEAWVAYVGYLQKSGRVDDAKAAIAEAGTRLPTEPAYVRLMSLAQLHEAAGERDLATEQVRKALDAASDNAQVRLAASIFFNRTGNAVEAKQHLDWVLDPDRDVPENIVTVARRWQAIVTAATGRHDDVEKAVELLGVGAESGEVSTGDLRTQIALLGRRRSLRVQRQVLALLEELRSREPLSPSEKLQLAALYERTGDWPQGKAVLQELSTADPQNPDYVAAIVLGGVRHELADAGTRKNEVARQLRLELDRLRSLAPDALRTAVAAAAFENGLGRREEAEQELRRFLASLSGPKSRGGAEITVEERAEILAAAKAAEEFKLFNAAEELFAAYGQSPPRPEQGLELAMFLGRIGRYTDGLALVKELSSASAPEATAVAAVSIVSLGRPSPEDLAATEEIVAQALKAAPESSRTLNLLGGLRMAQAQYDEAEAIYRRVLAEDPLDLSALNNLAWLLAMTGKKESLSEAQRLIDDAIAVAGPLADLIDTLGMIHLARQRPDKAIEELQDAFADDPSPSMGFHLALAHDQRGDREAARKALADAHRIGLAVERLHVTEHDVYRQLVRKIGSGATAD